MSSRAIQAMRLPPGLKRAIDNYCDGLLDGDRREFGSAPYKVAMTNCSERWNEVLIEYGIAVRAAAGSSVANGVRECGKDVGGPLLHCRKEQGHAGSCECRVGSGS